MVGIVVMGLATVFAAVIVLAGSSRRVARQGEYLALGLA